MLPAPPPGRAPSTVPVSALLVALVVLALLAVPPRPPAALAQGDGGGGGSGGEAVRTVLVLDSSGSMAEPAGGGRTKIAAAKEALTRVVDALPADAEVGVRVFGAEVFSRDQPGACTDSQLVVEPGTDNREELARAVERYRPYGETPIGYALQQAADDLGPGDGPRSIVLVSDGLATCDPDPCAVARDLSERGIDLRVDVVGLGVDAAARAQLRCVAAAADGSYHDASSAEEIVEGLTTAAERALRPFEIDGEPVTGGGSLEEALALAPGRYADVMTPRAAERWYRYDRRLDGGTVVASYYELQPGALGDLSVTAVDADGRPCGGAPTTTFHTLFTGYARLVPPDAEGCEDTVWVSVERRGGDDAPRAAFGLTLAEEPAVDGAEPLPDEAAVEDAFAVPRPDRRGEPVEPGTAFADAAPLEPGRTYDATIVPGEVHAFRVDVGWGQRLTVQVDRPGLSAALDEAVDEATSYFQLQVLNPVRATVQDDTPGGATGDAVGEQRVADAPTRQLTSVGPVRWTARDDGGHSAYLAGEYYVLYGAGFETERSVELPYRITVEVQGEEVGAPAYGEPGALVTAADQLPAPADPSEAPTGDGSAADDPADAAGDDAGDGGDGQDGSGGVPVALLAGAAAAVAAAVVVLLVLRRRRRT